MKVNSCIKEEYKEGIKAKKGLSHPVFWMCLNFSTDGFDWLTQLSKDKEGGGLV